MKRERITGKDKNGAVEDDPGAQGRGQHKFQVGYFNVETTLPQEKSIHEDQ